MVGVLSSGWSGALESSKLFLLLKRRMACGMAGWGREEERRRRVSGARKAVQVEDDMAAMRRSGSGVDDFIR